MANGRRIIIINKRSSDANLERAYSEMVGTYRKLINQYVSNSRQEIETLLSEAGCSDRNTMARFLKGENVAPTGKDLERLLSYTKLQNQFVGAVPVRMSKRVINPQPLTDVSDLSLEIQRKIAKILSTTTWFYSEASNRFIANSPLSQK